MPKSRDSQAPDSLDGTDELPALQPPPVDELQDTGTHLFRMPAPNATVSEVEDPLERTTVFHPEQLAALRGGDGTAASRLQAELTETRGALEDALEQLADREMALAALRVELRDSRSDHAADQKRLQALELALKQARQSEAQLQGQHEQVLAELQGLQASDLLTRGELMALREELNASSAQLQASERALAARTSEAEALREEREALRQQLASRPAPRTPEAPDGHEVETTEAQVLAEALQDLRAYVDRRSEAWRSMQSQLALREEALAELRRELAQRERQQIDDRRRLQALEAAQGQRRLQSAAVPPEATPALSAAAAQPPQADGGEFHPRRALVAMVGGTRLRYPLPDGEIRIGRTTDNHIQLRTQFVSRAHARILCDTEACVVEDLGSRNGVLVNGQPVTRQQLRHGDQLVFGETRFGYEENADEDRFGRTLN